MGKETTMTDEDLRKLNLPQVKKRHLDRWFELFREDHPSNEKVEEEEVTSGTRD